MAWNPFKKNKEEQNSLEDNSLELKVEAALKKAREEKRLAEKDINNIKSWAAEAVVETYADVFPNGHLTYYREQYKEKALATYEQIKAENADKISPEKAEQCDKIVKGYLTQIELREAKIKLYDKLISEYEATKNKLKQIEKQKESSDKLSKHQDRLTQLDSDSGIYVDAVTDSDELKELKREFELKAEYMTQLDKLSSKYSADTPETFDTSSAFKDELDSITKSLE